MGLFTEIKELNIKAGDLIEVKNSGDDYWHTRRFVALLSDDINTKKVVTYMDLDGKISSWDEFRTVPKSLLNHLVNTTIKELEQLNN